MATGIDRIRRTSQADPLGEQVHLHAHDDLRWTSRLVSKASVSTVTVTALDRVPDRHEAQVDPPVLDGGEHLGDGGEGEVGPARSG